MDKSETKICNRCGRWYPYKNIIDRFWHEDDAKECIRNIPTVATKSD